MKSNLNPPSRISVTGVADIILNASPGGMSKKVNGAREHIVKAWHPEGTIQASTSVYWHKPHPSASRCIRLTYRDEFGAPLSHCTVKRLPRWETNLRHAIYRLRKKARHKLWRIENRLRGDDDNDASGAAMLVPVT